MIKEIQTHLMSLPEHEAKIAMLNLIVFLNTFATAVGIPHETISQAGARGRKQGLTLWARAVTISNSQEAKL